MLNVLNMVRNKIDKMSVDRNWMKSTWQACLSPLSLFIDVLIFLGCVSKLIPSNIRDVCLAQLRNICRILVEIPLRHHHWYNLFCLGLIVPSLSSCGWLELGWPAVTLQTLWIIVWGLYGILRSDFGLDTIWWYHSHKFMRAK